jgi:hypothetical protein
MTAFAIGALGLLELAHAGAPTSRHTYNPKPAAAVDAAIRALGFEYADAQTGGKTKLRSSCNYFKEHRSDDVTPEAIIAALERGVRDNSSQAYYVKCQLLSGIDGNIPDELVSRALIVYKDFAPLEPQPGMKQDTRSDLELRRRACREDGITDLNKHISDMQDEASAANEPILKFRDELFSRLPANYDVIASGFEDAIDRLKAGADSKSIVDASATATRQWMANAEAAQLRSMVVALKTLEKERGTQYYDSVSWSDTTKKASFYRKSPALDKRTIDQLIKELSEQASNPTPGGLKFKDETGKNVKKDKS